MTFFKDLFGFEEKDYDYNQSKFKVLDNGRKLKSRVNNKVFSIGTFSTPSLSSLRKKGASLELTQGEPIVKHISTENILDEHSRY